MVYGLTHYIENPFLRFCPLNAHIVDTTQELRLFEPAFCSLSPSYFPKLEATPPPPQTHTHTHTPAPTHTVSVLIGPCSGWVQVARISTVHLSRMYHFVGSFLMSVHSATVPSFTSCLWGLLPFHPPLCSAAIRYHHRHTRPRPNLCAQLPMNTSSEPFKPLALRQQDPRTCLEGPLGGTRPSRRVLWNLRASGPVKPLPDRYASPPLGAMQCPNSLLAHGRGAAILAHCGRAKPGPCRFATQQCGDTLYPSSDFGLSKVWPGIWLNQNEAGEHFTSANLNAAAVAAAAATPSVTAATVTKAAPTATEVGHKHDFRNNRRWQEPTGGRPGPVLVCDPPPAPPPPPPPPPSFER